MFTKEIGEQLSKAVYDELNKRLAALGSDMSEGTSIDHDMAVIGELDKPDHLNVLKHFKSKKNLSRKNLRVR